MNQKKHEKQKETYSCPYEECGRKFEQKKELESHINHRHKQKK